MVKFQRRLTGYPSPRSAPSAKLAAERDALLLPSSHPARSFSFRAPELQAGPSSEATLSPNNVVRDPQVSTPAGTAPDLPLWVPGTSPR